MGVFSEMNIDTRFGETTGTQSDIEKAMRIKAEELEDARQEEETKAARKLLEDLEEREKEAKDENSDPESDEVESENKKRKEHEEAEAKRKAEWEARRKAKEEAELFAWENALAMDDDALVAASMKRVGDDAERLTRRNMKQCVTEMVQTYCLEDPDFARQVMHPRKNMIRCFRYINRKAKAFIEQEMKDNDEKPVNGIYGSDVPDDLCYQWAREYFMDMDAEEDKENDEKFVSRPYTGKSVSKPKKKPEKKKAEPKKEVSSTDTDFSPGEQLSLFSIQGGAADE